MAPRRRPPCIPVRISSGSGAGAGLAEAITSMQHMVLEAAFNGDLPALKRLVRVLDNDSGRIRAVVEAARNDQGTSALQVAAGNQQLEMCSYLVETLGVDVDSADNDGRTPLVYAVLSESAAVVKYLLDHDADPNKADNNQMTPLHSAAGLGDCEMIELLIAKGAYVDPIGDEIGTPLLLATQEQKFGAMKTLLDHNADAAIRASTRGGVAGPVRQSGGGRGRGQGQRRRRERHAVRTEEVEVKVDLKNEQANKRKVEQLKSFASKAIERKDYTSASAFYTKAIVVDPKDATLFSNRSLCWLRTGDGPKALLDALDCREMRPDWPKACYRQGAALMLLKDCESACDALLDGLKLDPKNGEMESALREAMESLKISKLDTRAT